MFIKLTKIDGSPVWINASFVVTVEPSRGGSVVVPVGDGLDYDVREKPEAVLALLDGAPPVAVLPVPAVDALAPAPADVSPEPESVPPPQAEDSKPKTARKTSVRKSAAKKKSAASAPAAAPAAAPAPETEEKPRPVEERPKTAEEIQAEFQAAVVGGEDAVAKRRRAPKTDEEFVAPLTDEQLSRIRKMMPGKVSALNNTLTSQFGVAPAYVDAARDWMVKQGVMAMVGNRIAWL